MKNLLILILFFCQGLNAQSTTPNKTYISKKKVYQVRYDSTQWQLDPEPTKWHLRMKDTYDMLTLVFQEYDFFQPVDKIKKAMRAQFTDVGNIKEFKCYKKTLKHLTVDYYEFEVKYKGYIYKYVGFYYDNGRSGSVQLQFSGQVENIDKLQNLIAEFYNGFSEIK